MKIKTIILLLLINFSFIYSGNSLYCDDLNILQLSNNNDYFAAPYAIKKYTEQNTEDTLRTRYYEAPYDELPFGTFKVIDTTSIIIYTQKKSHKRYGSYTKYYYSLNLKSRIHELSIDNLEVDFADNIKFLELIKKNNIPLGKIVNGVTVINNLLIESLKQ